MANHTVFRHGDKLDRYDCNSSTGEKGSDSKTMSRSSEEVISFTTGADSTYWEAAINSHCSSASTTPISSNATPANIGVICSRKLQLRNKIIRRGEDRTAMVGTESSLRQWEVSYILPSPVTNNFRCIFRRLGCILSRTQNRGAMGITKEKRSYKYFRTESSKICNFNFHSLVPTAKTIRIKMDNITALSYLVKMGGTRNQLLVQISKEIWEYLLDKGITITAEYLPGALNREADMQSRTVKESSEWKLNPAVFQNLCKSWWTPDIDLFASRVSHQVPAYFSWKLDPYRKGRDAYQMRWTHTKGYAFPPVTKALDSKPFKSQIYYKAQTRNLIL